MRVSTLISQLGEMDPDARVVVSICGHLIDIACASGEVNSVDLLLLDTSVTSGQDAPKCAWSVSDEFAEIRAARSDPRGECTCEFVRNDCGVWERPETDPHCPVHVR